MRVLGNATIAHLCRERLAEPEFTQLVHFLPSRHLSQKTGDLEANEADEFSKSFMRVTFAFLSACAHNRLPIYCVVLPLFIDKDVKMSAATAVYGYLFVTSIADTNSFNSKFVEMFMSNKCTRLLNRVRERDFSVVFDAALLDDEMAENMMPPHFYFSSQYVQDDKWINTTAWFTDIVWPHDNVIPNLMFDNGFVLEIKGSQFFFDVKTATAWPWKHCVRPEMGHNELQVADVIYKNKIGWRRFVFEKMRNVKSVAEGARVLKCAVMPLIMDDWLGKAAVQQLTNTRNQIAKDEDLRGYFFQPLSEMRFRNIGPECHLLVNLVATLWIFSMHVNLIIMAVMLALSSTAPAATGKRSYGMTLIGTHGIGKSFCYYVTMALGLAAHYMMVGGLSNVVLSRLSNMRGAIMICNEAPCNEEKDQDKAAILKNATDPNPSMRPSYMLTMKRNEQGWKAVQYVIPRLIMFTAGNFKIGPNLAARSVEAEPMRTGDLRPDIRPLWQKVMDGDPATIIDPKEGPAQVGSCVESFSIIIDLMQEYCALPPPDSSLANYYAAKALPGTVLNSESIRKWEQISCLTMYSMQWSLCSLLLRSVGKGIEHNLPLGLDTVVEDAHFSDFAFSSEADQAQWERAFVNVQRLAVGLVPDRQHVLRAAGLWVGNQGSSELSNMWRRWLVSAAVQRQKRSWHEDEQRVYFQVSGSTDGPFGLPDSVCSNQQAADARKKVMGVEKADDNTPAISFDYKTKVYTVTKDLLRRQPSDDALATLNFLMQVADAGLCVNVDSDPSLVCFPDGPWSFTISGKTLILSPAKVITRSNDVMCQGGNALVFAGCLEAESAAIEKQIGWQRFTQDKLPRQTVVLDGLYHLDILGIVKPVESAGIKVSQSTVIKQGYTLDLLQARNLLALDSKGNVPQMQAVANCMGNCHEPEESVLIPCPSSKDNPLPFTVRIPHTPSVTVTINENSAFSEENIAAASLPKRMAIMPIKFDVDDDLRPAQRLGLNSVKKHWPNLQSTDVQFTLATIKEFQQSMATRDKDFEPDMLL